MIDTGQYWRKWCPYCHSPRLDRVGLTRTSGNQNIELGELQCLNCKRVFDWGKVVRGYDRAAMRRDQKRLGRLLAKKGGE